MARAGVDFVEAEFEIERRDPGDAGTDGRVPRPVVASTDDVNSAPLGRDQNNLLNYRMAHIVSDLGSPVESLRRWRQDFDHQSWSVDPELVARRQGHARHRDIGHVVACICMGQPNAHVIQNPASCGNVVAKQPCEFCLQGRMDRPPRCHRHDDSVVQFVARVALALEGEEFVHGNRLGPGFGHGGSLAHDGNGPAE
jgi:hypothetical protein